MTSLVVRKEVCGGIGLVKLERVRVICPTCGQQVEAVATDGQVKGYCAVAKQYVDFLIETQLERKKWWLDPEYRAKLKSAMKKKWQDPEYRAKQTATHIGRHPTTETRAKISAALTRRHNKNGVASREVGKGYSRKPL
jgi:endogenous inhibitor of DNA gyrase (YacG/DUF329 family)